MLSKKQEKWLKEGRGQGELADYKPWIKISDISSSGRSHRVFGHKTKRTHHLLSDLELATFLFLEWSPTVLDIREQFPLNYDDTLTIAEEKQVKHPSVRGDIHIMTSDFYVVSSNENYSQFVLQAKYSKDLDDIRTIEKLEIERHYWQSKGIPWQIITEKDIPKIIQNNIAWLYPESNSEITLNIAEKLDFYVSQFSQTPSMRIIDLCKEIDSAYFGELGASLNEIRKLLALRFFTFNILIDFRRLKCSDIQITNINDWSLITEEIRYVSNQ